MLQLTFCTSFTFAQPLTMWSTAGLIVLVWIGAISRSIAPLNPLLHPSSKHTRLGFSTRQLSGLRCWTVFFSLIVRAIASRVIRLRPVQVIERVDARPVLQGGDTSLSMPFEVTQEELARYAEAAGIEPSDILDHPLHLLLFLSAVTEPAMLLLLSKVNCPVDPVGSVNTRNHFEALEPPRLISTLRDAVKGAGKEVLSVQASLGEGVVKVKRGWEVTIVVDLVAGSDPLYRQSFTFLQFHKHRQPLPTPTTTDVTPSVSTTKTRSDTVRITNSDPGRWASLSKDYNPIHFFAPVAKLFGFKARIAHGNHVLAKAVTELYPLGKAPKLGSSLSVDFRRPVFVPSELDIRESRDGKGATEIEIGSGDKVQVGARFSP